MVFISYSIPDLSRLLDLAKRYPFIEIRQDLCNYNFNELELILQVVEFPILTIKGDFERIKPVLEFGIRKRAFLIDFDFNWGKMNFDILLNESLQSSINENFIISQHIDFNEFIKYNSNDYIIDLINWNTRFVKLVIENIDTKESYEKIKYVLECNNEKVAVFFAGQYGRISRIEAFKNNCPLNYAACQDIRINDSQLSISEYEKLV